MAKKIVTDKTKREREPLPPIRCKGCTAIFTPKTQKEHFHSALCRENYYRRTYFAKVEKEVVCRGCSITFTTTKPGRQFYCTPECREKHRDDEREKLGNSVAAERSTLEDRVSNLEKEVAALKEKLNG